MFGYHAHDFVGVAAILRDGFRKDRTFLCSAHQKGPLHEPLAETAGGQPLVKQPPPKGQRPERNGEGEQHEDTGNRRLKLKYQ